MGSGIYGYYGLPYLVNSSNSTLNYIFHNSGGLSYHLKAFLYSKKLWTPFKLKIEDWLLNTWNPQSENLVLIGPSAGYQLSVLFLSKFKKITIYEPDPIALFILKKKLKKINAHIVIHCESVLFLENSTPTLNGVKKLIEQNSGASFLFCNLLGQVSVINEHTKEAQWINWSQEFMSLFVNKNWASYHDVFSGPIRPHLASLEGIEILKSSATKKSFLNVVYSSLGESKPSKIEVFDHKFFHCFKGMHQEYFLWQIEPKMFHIISAVCQSNK